MGAGGLNAALRDMAKLGLLYLNDGKNHLGQSLVSRNWVQSSVTADAPHLQPGKRASSDWVLGYGYQWWLPLNPDGDFCAIGIYGQFIYVYPKHNVVIVKTSAYRDYNSTGELMEIESLAVFRALAQAIQSEQETAGLGRDLAVPFAREKVLPAVGLDSDGAVFSLCRF